MGGGNMNGGNGEGKEAADWLPTVATRLFAELGYDAVSTEMIAAAAGVEPGVVIDRYGGKRGLYVEAFLKASQGWAEHLRSFDQDFVPGPEGLIRIVDSYVEYCLEHPEFPRLLIYRWMADASDIADLEEPTTALLTRESVRYVSQVVRPELDAESVMWTLTWTIHGYLQAGYLDASGRRTPPEDPDSLRRFLAHMRQLIGLLAR